MSIEKKILRKNQVCKVKFCLPKEVVREANSAHLVGDFNNWDGSQTPMKKTKDGSYTVTIELKTGREYQFRYLIDDQRWENDLNADNFVPNGFGDSYNSVLSV